MEITKEKLTSELPSVPFHQIMGAPLLAIVQGQTQASQATVEFIERIGFIQEDKEGSSSKEGLVGKLRMVHFHYNQPDSDGSERTLSVRVPLLSIVPIPSIEIDEVNLEYNIKIATFESKKFQSSLSDTKKEESPDWLSKDRMEFKASMGRMQGNEQNRLDFQMKVKMKIKQADITPGMSQLFKLMEESTSVKEESDQVSN